MTTEVALDTPAVVDPPAPVTETAPPVTPPPAQVPVEPKTKRATRAQEPARMSDDTKPVAPSIPVEIVQQLAQYEALKAESAKVIADRDALAKSVEEMKTSVASFQEKFGSMEAHAKKLADENRGAKISTAIRLAAMEMGAIDADDVTELLARKFTLDETGAVILADDTKAKCVDAVKSFLEKKPHMLGRKVASGSGASPYPAQSAPANGKKPDLTTNEGLTEYTRTLGTRR